MPVIDIGNSCAIVPLHNPGSYTADRNGNSADTVNFAYGVLILNIGNITSPQNVTFFIEHSETAGGAYQGCNTLGTNNAAAIRAQDAQDNSVLVARIDFNNTKRFIRARADHSGGGSQTYGAVLLMVPYQSDAVSPDTGAAYQPNISI